MSLLQARVSVFDSSGRLLQSVAATDPRSGDLTLHVTGVRAGSTYFVRVESATASPFGVGSYKLAVGTDAYAAVFPSSLSFINPDGHGNDTWGTATNMGVTRADGTAAWDLTVRASIEDEQDRDVYKFKTSNLTGGALVLSIWAIEPGRLSPEVRVYDNNGNLLPVEVLASDGTYYSIQIRDVRPNAVLFVKVARGSEWAIRAGELLPGRGSARSADRNRPSCFRNADRHRPAAGVPVDRRSGPSLPLRSVGCADEHRG